MQIKMQKKRTHIPSENATDYHIVWHLVKMYGTLSNKKYIQTVYINGII